MGVVKIMETLIYEMFGSFRRFSLHKVINVARHCVVLGWQYLNMILTKL